MSDELVDNIERLTGQDLRLAWISKLLRLCTLLLGPGLERFSDLEFLG